MLDEMLLNGGIPPITSLTRVLSATSTLATITYPAGIQAGDLILLIDRAAGTTSSLAIPTGFTQISTTATVAQNLFPYRVTYSYKIATGTETGNITGQDGSTSDAKTMIVFRGSRPISSVTSSELAFDQTHVLTKSLLLPTSGLPAQTLVLSSIFTGNTSTVLSMTQTPSDFNDTISSTAFSVVDFQYFPNSITTNYTTTSTTNSVQIHFLKGLSLTVT